MVGNETTGGVRLSRTQRVVLNYPPGFYGLAEIELQTGVFGAALQSSIASCRRRGWLDESGMLTFAGEAALSEPQA